MTSNAKMSYVQGDKRGQQRVGGRNGGNEVVVVQANCPDCSGGGEGGKGATEQIVRKIQSLQGALGVKHVVDVSSDRVVVHIAARFVRQRFDRVSRNVCGSYMMEDYVRTYMLVGEAFVTKLASREVKWLSLASLWMSMRCQYVIR